MGGAALIALAVVGATHWRTRDALPPTRALPNAPGFLRLAGARQASSAQTALLGIAAPGSAREAPPAPLGPDALCQALYRGRGGGGIRVVLFSDIQCGPCRQVAPLLTGAGVTEEEVLLHDWPLLGPHSAEGARVSVAAGLQGAELAMHRHVIAAGLRPSEAGLTSAAEAVGIDGARLLRDLESPVVTERLRETSAVARQLRLSGTPSFVIGRVVVEGLPTRGLLRQLLRQEGRAEPSVCSGGR